MVARLLYMYEARSVVSSRMLGICNRVEGICKAEVVNYIDLQDSFSSDSSLFDRDGLHLNRTGTTRLGRELDKMKQVFSMTKIEKQLVVMSRNYEVWLPDVLGLGQGRSLKL